MKFTAANWQGDVLVLMASQGVRAFAFSYISVVFAIYLAQLGYSTVTVGLIFSTGYATSALLTAVWGLLAAFISSAVLRLGLPSHRAWYHSDNFDLPDPNCLQHSSIIHGWRVTMMQ